MEFNELKLHPDLQKGIEDSGYITCMPVQEQVLRNAFGGADLYVQSQTGTGKTAAYLVAIFQRLLTEPLLGGRKALIMVPTRELAVQVEDEAKKIAKYLPYKVGSFYGGVGYAHQQKLLKENAQIMVGTPGRVLDLNSSGQMSLMDISFLILDEADRMFDMGFYPDLRKLIQVVPPADRRQTMLFSATLNAWVKNLAWEYTKEPLEIEIEPENVTVDEIDQLLYHVPSNDKMKLLLGIFQNDKPESAIIFCNTKRFTEIIAKRLKINGIDCEFIIGDLPQFKRLQIIEDVKSGKNKYLVATDVAARGLDIEGLAMVVNYDLPNEAENYVHRIGRTARAGKTGKAISLASEQDVYGLPAIEKYLEKKIPSQTADSSLYAEDKSEGMRIRTDDYDDRGGGDRHGSRAPAGGRHGEHRGERRDGRVSESRAPRRGDNRSDHDRSRPAETSRPGPVQAAPRDNRVAAKPDLSRISFEERLAYYRRKYGAGQEANAQNAAAADLGRTGTENPRGDRNRAPNDRRRSRPPVTASGENLENQTKEAQGRNGPSRGGRRGPESQGEDRTNNQRRQGSPATPSNRAAGPGNRNPSAQKATGPVASTGTGTPRKSIIGRLLGLFGKK